MDLFLKKYRIHRDGARQRGIEFLFTFEEWKAIWLESGRWVQRGGCGGKYVMARFGDKGSYAVGNVKIILFEENRAEQVGENHPSWGKIYSPEERARISARQSGEKHYNWGKNLSRQTKAKKSVSMKQHYQDNPETRASISRGVLAYYATHSQAMKGKKQSDETRAKLREAWKRRRARMEAG